MVVKAHQKFVGSVQRHPRIAVSIAIGILLGILLIAGIVGLRALQVRSETKLRESQEQTAVEVADLLYENSLASCDRGNKIRIVVYRNTKTAVAQDPTRKGFQLSLNELQDTPFINLKTGEINCVKSIPKPKGAIRDRDN